MCVGKSSWSHPRANALVPSLGAEPERRSNLRGDALPRMPGSGCSATVTLQHDTNGHKTGVNGKRAAVFFCKCGPQHSRRKRTSRRRLQSSIDATGVFQRLPRAHTTHKSVLCSSLNNCIACANVGGFCVARCPPHPSPALVRDATQTVVSFGHSACTLSLSSFPLRQTTTKVAPGWGFGKRVFPGLSYCLHSLCSLCPFVNIGRLCLLRAWYGAVEMHFHFKLKALNVLNSMLCGRAKFAKRSWVGFICNIYFLAARDYLHPETYVNWVFLEMFFCATCPIARNAWRRLVFHD